MRTETQGAAVRPLPVRLIRVGVLALVAAGLVAVVNPIVFGAPEKLIHIKWRDAADPEKPALEQRWRLSEGRSIYDTTWSYLPGDTSSETLGAIVRHPKVEDTDGIDRKRFVLRRNPLTPRRGGLLPSLGRLGGRAGKGLAYLLGLGGGALLVLGLAMHKPVQQWVAAMVSGRRTAAGSS